MARFKNVVIRSKEKMKHMGELGEVLHTIGTDHCVIEIPEEEVPLVYQYSKGKTPGETINPLPGRTIGGVTNVRIDEEGNLVGDVRLCPMMRLSAHYQGVIDNLLVAKTFPLEEEGEEKRETNPTYKLEQLIVYDKEAVKEQRKLEQGNSMVEKTYPVPHEVYDAPPGAGERLKTVLNRANEELEDVLNEKTWKGKKV